ncbi:MAG: ABC transporter substrate-binding protein [Ignavibacteriales bacterium]
MNGKHVALAMVVIMLLGCVGCSSKAPAPAQGTPAQGTPAQGASEPIKIGSIAPLTGPIATYGQSHRNAVDLAVAQVNEKGGIRGRQVKVIHEDSQGDPVVGANAALKLAEQDKVLAIIGPVASKVGMAAAPVAEQAKIPMVVTGTNPDITKGKPFVFRSCWTDDFQGLVMAKFCTDKLQAKTAAVLYDLGNDYAKSVAEIFVKTFQDLGGKITTVQTHPTDATDFRAQLSTIKAGAPDVFFFSDFYNDANLIGKQAREVGIKSTLVGCDGWDSPDLDLKALDGAYYCSHFSKEDPRPETKAFVEAYKSKYGSDPDLLAIMAYDAAVMVLNSIDRAGDKMDSQSIRDAMASIKGLKAAQGDISLNENGDPTTLPAAVLLIKDGKTQYVQSFAAN